MLSAAASAIPRLRWAAPPRHTSSRTQWLLLRQRPLYSSSTSPNAAAAGPGPLEAPDLSRLAKSARISLSPQEAEEFAPKIQQVVDWFGQLQAVDLESIEPSLRAALEAPIGSPWVKGDGGSVRADVFRVVARFHFFQAALPPPPLHLPTVPDTAVGSSLREDKAEPFANRDAIIEALPSYDDPYIKVPRVLNSE